MTEAEREALLRTAGESRTIDFDASPEAAEEHAPASPAATASPAAGTAPVSSFMFQGKTTFAEVMAQGITQAQIETVLGMPMGSKLQSVKDFSDRNGLRYSAIRAGLSQPMTR